MHRILKYSNSAEQKYKVKSSFTSSRTPLLRDSHCQYCFFLVLLVITVITLYKKLEFSLFNCIFDVVTVDRAIIF